MKIRIYLAFLIVACLLGGYSIELILSNQYSNVNVMSKRYSDNRLWLSDFERSITDSNQYLISADLVIGSGESYLANGAKKKGKLIADSLKELHQSNQLLHNSHSLQDLLASILKINDYLEKAESIQGDQRMATLALILNSYDSVAFSLTSRLNKLKVEADIAIASDYRKLQSLQLESENVKIITRIVFSIFLLVIWFWANRKISRPLIDLCDMALAAQSGHSFNGVEQGPKEIKQLSNNIKEMTNTLSYQATHDPLTLLQNRRAFDRNLLLHISEADTNANNHVLCFIDLDRFKAINDNCGHAAGDELLQYVSRLIEENTRSSDLVARMGGDEFAILLVDCDIEHGIQICNQVCMAIREIKFVRDEQIFRISASIGITLVNSAEESMADLLNAADTACKFVKDSGRDRVHVFDVRDEHLQEKRSQNALINQLNTAIDENSFVLFRQRIVPLGDQHELGRHFEVLVRMRTVDGVLIAPNQFLPLAERYDLCKQVDMCVVNTTIDWFLENPGELDKLELCAINLSGQSIGSDDFRKFIIDKLRSSNFPAEKLCFEITETAAISNLGTAVRLMENLQQFGCKFALDDFGSGLSSFGYLKSLPVDLIKIDGAFVKDMIDDHINYSTVKSIADLAKALGKKTVAEFVENEEIVESLKQIGVDYAQGFHFDRPTLFIEPLLPQNQSVELPEEPSSKVPV